MDFAKAYDWVGLAAALAQDTTLINAQPDGRWTALHQAVMAGEKSVVEWLLYSRADIKKKNNDGQTAIDLAQRGDIVELLMTASHDSFHPKEAPQAPTAVGGYLPYQKGGNEADYYWPPQYDYQKTFEFHRATLEAL